MESVARAQARGPESALAEWVPARPEPPLLQASVVSAGQAPSVLGGPVAGVGAGARGVGVAPGVGVGAPGVGALPVGYYAAVPAGYATVAYAGYTCRFVGGVYYRAVTYQGQTVWWVVA